MLFCVYLYLLAAWDRFWAPWFGSRHTHNGEQDPWGGTGVGGEGEKEGKEEEGERVILGWMHQLYTHR